MSKQLQKNYMENKHAFCKKVKTKEGRGVSIGIESKDGTVLMEKNEVKDRWREYFSELLGGEETVSSNGGRGSRRGDGRSE